MVINGDSVRAEAAAASPPQPPKELNASNGVTDMSATNPEVVHAGAKLFTDPPATVDERNVNDSYVVVALR
jgi:hypothetical protein